jgi:hypothetical protein
VTSVNGRHQLTEDWGIGRRLVGDHLHRVTFNAVGCPFGEHKQSADRHRCEVGGDYAARL